MIIRLNARLLKKETQMTKDNELVDEVAERMAGEFGDGEPNTVLAQELITLITSRKDGWVSVLDELPVMYLVQDDRAGGHWYKSDQHIWATNGEMVVKTNFFQVWPDRGEARAVGIGMVTHWMHYKTPEPPQ
jgi:hypothetical protein